MGKLWNPPNTRAGEKYLNGREIIMRSVIE